MSETLESMATDVDQRQLAEQLLAQAKEHGVELVGPNGLLNELTKNVLETALDAEMSEHLGYDKHDPVENLFQWPPFPEAGSREPILGSANVQCRRLRFRCPDGAVTRCLRPAGRFAVGLLRPAAVSR